MAGATMVKLTEIIVLPHEAHSRFLEDLRKLVMEYDGALLGGQAEQWRFGVDQCRSGAFDRWLDGRPW